MSMTRTRWLLPAFLFAALSRPDRALAQDDAQPASPGSGTVGTTIGPQFPSVGKNTLLFGNLMVDYGQKDWPVEVVGGIAGASGSGGGYHISTFAALVGGQVKRDVGNGVAPYCGAGLLAGSVSVKISGLASKSYSVGGVWADAGVRFAVGDQVEVGPSAGFELLQVRAGGKTSNAAGPWAGFDIAFRFGAGAHRAVQHRLT